MFPGKIGEKPVQREEAAWLVRCSWPASTRGVVRRSGMRNMCSQISQRYLRLLVKKTTRRSKPVRNLILRWPEPHLGQHIA